MAPILFVHEKGENYEFEFYFYTTWYYSNRSRSVDDCSFR